MGDINAEKEPRPAIFEGRGTIKSLVFVCNGEPVLVIIRWPHLPPTALVLHCFMPHLTRCKQRVGARRHAPSASGAPVGGPRPRCGPQARLGCAVRAGVGGGRRGVDRVPIGQHPAVDAPPGHAHRGRPLRPQAPRPAPTRAPPCTTGKGAADRRCEAWMQDTCKKLQQTRNQCQNHMRVRVSDTRCRKAR